MAQKVLVMIMHDGTELRPSKRYEYAEAVQAKAALERLLITENTLVPGKGPLHQSRMIFRQDVKAIEIRDAYPAC